MKDTLTWKIGGEAGFGIMSAGTMLSKILTRLGYFTFAINEYPSLIRGGHNIITVRMSINPIWSMNYDLHILAALNRETVDIHKKELSNGAYVIYDSKEGELKQSDFSNEVILIPIPLSELNAKFGGESVMRNTIMLGATLSLLGLNFDGLEQLLTEQFRKKGDAVIKLNTDVAKAGYDFISSTYADQESMRLSKSSSTDQKAVVNGSEALGIGAVRAGLKFAAIYPMTPINAVIPFLIEHAKTYDIIYKQPEDEIAGINMAIGASIAGLRSMVATSGGGFALMVEGVSLAGTIEAPVVIDLGMRPGPATGMPTWTEQGELRMAIHAGHGEFARVVFAPGDAQETYELTVDAFNLAEKYQIPVFLLTDKYLNESLWTVPVDVLKQPVTLDRGKLVHSEDIANSKDFKRYNLDTSDGVSPRSVPGMAGGYHMANSYEHDEFGYVTDNPVARTKMYEKRLKKIESLTEIAKPPKIYGDIDADITFVSWGTNKGPIMEAIELLKQIGKKANFVHYTWLFPFPVTHTKEILSKAKVLIDVELNGTAQLSHLIAEYTSIQMNHTFLKFEGRQWYPDELVERVKSL